MLKILAKRSRLLGIAVLAFACLHSPALAKNVDLYAGTLTKTMPDGAVVTMWGYGLAPGAITSPGPSIEVPAGDTTLSITLHNNLPVDTCIVIPGLVADGMAPVKFVDDSGRMRASSFDRVAAPGGSFTYTFNNVRPGTYLYASGAHPAVQVQMGLYGAAKKDFGAKQAYDGVAYDTETLLLYSEIDPALHTAVATGNYGPGKAMTSTVDYDPKYFLINGKPHSSTAAAIRAGQPGGKTLVRLINAGLNVHSPSLVGQYMTLVGRDAQPVRYPEDRFTMLLPPQKTLDVLIDMPAQDSVVPVMDRGLTMVNGAMGGLGGSFAYLSACPADVNGDKTVTMADLLALRSQLGATCSFETPCTADVNFDGAVNFTDFMQLRALIGQNCAIAN